MKNNSNLNQKSIEKRDEITSNFNIEHSRLLEEGKIREAEKIVKQHKRWIKQGRPVLMIEKNAKITKKGYEDDIRV